MTLIILMGNVGTGKTTYRNDNFKSNEIILCPDEWADLDIEQRQKKLISDLEKHLSTGKTVVLDGNNLSKKSRSFHICLAKKANSNVSVLDFGPGDDNSLLKRLRNPGSLTQEEWKNIHSNNQSKYQEPSLEEGIAFIEKNF